MSAKIDLLTLFPDELRVLFEKENIPKFRAAQVYGWLHKGVGFDEMKNLPKALIAQLKEKYDAGTVQIEEIFESQKDDTKKFLFALDDGNIVEGVLMRYHYGNTLCISSQVGCKMGCAFCASTLEGCVRNLTCGEMLHMVLLTNRLYSSENQRGVTNIVIMGSGEPLDNYDEVVRFLRLVSEPSGVAISPRNISLSTCGLVPQIYRLMQEDLPITLAISLHAPNDDIRSQIMPISRRFSMQELMGACVEYTKRTKRRIVFEYALIDRLNNQTSHAKQLAALLRGMMCHVNLIPLNKVEERNLLPSAKAQTEAFLKTLSSLGISATVRREMGSDIDGACGQLRRRYLSEKESEPLGG